MIISVPLCSVCYVLLADAVKRRLAAKNLNDI